MLKEYSYNVGKTEAGLNIGVQLLKKFTLIPWVNYELFDTSDGVAKSEEARKNYQEAHAEMLDEDLEMFWHAQARLKYGIDFSVRLFGTVELHLGGLLGMITALGPKNEQITDKTISLSIAFDQKGN